MHPRQRELPSGIEKVWLAALDDTEIDPAAALIYTLDGETGDEYTAYWYPRGTWIPANGEPNAIHLPLDEMNHDDCIGADRIVVYIDRTIEAIAALIRHECEHARQYDVHGQNLIELHGLTVGVIRERVGDLPGGAILYQAIPVEMDANAAAAQFVRTRFGASRIDELLKACDKDSAAFRSLVGPPAIETLPDRVILFLATVPDLCQCYADRNEFAFPRLLDDCWPGAGAIWCQLVLGDALKGINR